jgi:DNA-binding SARP family transcriptional activator
MFVMHGIRTDEQSDSGCGPGAIARYGRRADEAVRPRWRIFRRSLPLNLGLVEISRRTREFRGMYDIRLFGRLEVRTRGIRLVGRDFGGAQPRHVLALLALHRELRTDELAELLRDGRRTVDVPAAVSVLRHRLDPHGRAPDSVIATTAGGYALVADQIRVDVARFDELIGAAAGRTAERALPPLTAAAHLAVRPLLAEESSTWASAARDTYRARLLAALLDAAGHALTTGRPGEALRLTERARTLDPTTERGRTLAVAAHRALGPAVAVPAAAA